MATGIVKWFNDAEGLGVIIDDDGGKELGAHFKCIQGDGFETLHEGQKVEFQITHGPKGLFADFIRPVLGEEHTTLF